ncbi:DUF1302 domain-containing protein [Glaciimonas immobilis]|uniref:DUF1302 domain-containing protein n=1 Tax=Glaciimonas immobilis TaxID=728004 RepID=A0A840S1C8_9BURK|nr:DUF1302 family protein [Glaciimonas immobilis]KAF3996177.1 DUF1302 domain-containing protein [Glaciimonas immobilis]MBB5202664.1 hypothetical protein [Glaciimonas immobilis]
MKSKRIARKNKCNAWARGSFGVLLAVAGVQAANAFDIDLGNDDLQTRWDNTIRYNLGVRGKNPDSRILNNPNYDESDGKFNKKGKVVTNRVDILSEFDMNYRKQFGVRVSAAGWYDNAYDDHSVRTAAPGGYSTSYAGNQYNSSVSRYVNGPSGEILDAFIWGNFKLGSDPVNVKFGRQTNYFGEGLLIPTHAISYSQSPLDGVKAVTSPGIETKEVFLPLNQLFAKIQVTPELTLAGQYFLDWRPSRLPYGGTYFAPADFFFEGPSRLPAAPGFNLSRTDSLTAKKSGNFGVSARLNVEPIESTVGAYYRQFDDYNPWYVPQATGFQPIPAFGGAIAPTQFRLVYPKNVKLAGLSISRAIGPVSFGSDISYRMGGALNAAGISAVDNLGPSGNTLHAVANGVYLLPATKFWDTGSLIAEIAYNRLISVTQHAELYKGVGSPKCLNPNGKPGNVSDGCSTKDYLGLAVLFTPEYLQVLPSWDLDLPMTLNYGLKGNAATSGGGNQNSLSWSVGAKMTYQQKYEFALKYADARSTSKYDPTGQTLVGGNGGSSTNDRGWLVFTFKTGF